jgi:hypothetical protein
VVKRLALIALLGACGSFEDPTIVIDNRVLAITAEPPEQVFELDPANPPETLEDLGLIDAEVCALIADPAEDRGLRWTMRVCAPQRGGRCADSAERPSFELGRGHLDDPETAATAQIACAILPADEGLLVVLEDAIMRDELMGFSGIDVQISLIVEPDDADDEATLFAEKNVRYAAKVPVEREANVNPDLERIDVDNTDPFPLALGRCADQPEPLRIAPGEELPLLPIEPDGVREDYVVPTFDGGSRMFTENLTYQWLASAGAWNRAYSGGPRDISGVPPPLGATWTAPVDDITEDTDVSIWIIQRDERLGSRWFESCVRVTPP